MRLRVWQWGADLGFFIPEAAYAAWAPCSFLRGFPAMRGARTRHRVTAILAPILRGNVAAMDFYLRLCSLTPILFAGIFQTVNRAALCELAVLHKCSPIHGPKDYPIASFDIDVVAYHVVF